MVILILRLVRGYSRPRRRDELRLPVRVSRRLLWGGLSLFPSLLSRVFLLGCDKVFLGLGRLHGFYFLYLMVPDVIGNFGRLDSLIFIALLLILVSLLFRVVVLILFIAESILFLGIIILWIFVFDFGLDLSVGRLRFPDGRDALQHLIAITERIKSQLLLLALAFGSELDDNSAVKNKQLLVLFQLLDVFNLDFCLPNVWVKTEQVSSIKLGRNLTRLTFFSNPSRWALKQRKCSVT